MAEYETANGSSESSSDSDYSREPVRLPKGQLDKFSKIVTKSNKTGRSKIEADKQLAKAQQNQLRAEAKYRSTSSDFLDDTIRFEESISSSGSEPIASPEMGKNRLPASQFLDKAAEKREKARLRKQKQRVRANEGQRNAEREKNAAAQLVARENREHREAEQKRDKERHKDNNRDESSRDLFKKRNRESHKTTRAHENVRAPEKKRDREARNAARKDDNYREPEKDQRDQRGCVIKNGTYLLEKTKFSEGPRESEILVIDMRDELTQF